MPQSLELLTALLEYLDLLHGIVQSAYFLAVKASLLSQNASIILDSYTYLLCSKLCWHNCLIPTYHKVFLSFVTPEDSIEAQPQEQIQKMKEPAVLQ